MPQILISYSHKDEKWKERLEVHLKGYPEEPHFEFWCDRQMMTSDFLV